MSWINYVLFTLWGQPVLAIDVVTSALGLVCVFLAGRNSKYNFWVGYLYTAALFFMFWNKSLYASLLLQPVSLAINIMGHWRWTHPRKHEESAADASALKVSMLSWPERGLVAVSVLLVAGLWGWTLDALFPADPHPYLDSCVTVLILVAILCSSLLSRLVKTDEKQRRTVVIEVGMQNAAQAIAIASSPFIFANEQMAIPAILYSLMMNIVLLIYVGLVRRKDRRAMPTE